MLLGMTSADIQLGRWSAWIEADSHRVLQIMQSIDVDDAHVWREVMSLLGTPFASHKSQSMRSEIYFLGDTTDLSNAIAAGFVVCWPRQRLLDKVRILLQIQVVERPLPLLQLPSLEKFLCSQVMR
eukprot:2778692-Amphidinium_carterae.1